MMIMTIWWSKATRLLEFSRSVNRTLRSRASTCGPGFFVTDRGGGGIGYSSSWIKCSDEISLEQATSQKYELIAIKHVSHSILNKIWTIVTWIPSSYVGSKVAQSDRFTPDSYNSKDISLKQVASHCLTGKWKFTTTRSCLSARYIKLCPKSNSSEEERSEMIQIAFHAANLPSCLAPLCGNSRPQ